MLGQPVWIDKFEALEVYSFPFRLGNLLTILLFTLIFSYLFAIARNVGAIALPYSIMLIYFSLIAFFGSLFLITDYSSLGYQEVPVVSTTILKSERGRFFKALIILSAILSQFLLMESVNLRYAYLCLCLIIIPLAISVLILESELFSALNPLKWVAVLMAVKFDTRFVQYFFLQICCLFIGYIALFVDYGFLNVVTMAVFLSTLITLFRSLGVVIHSNADALGFSVLYSKDIERSQTQKSENKALSGFCDSIYLQWMSGQQAIVLERLQSKLAEDSYESEAELFDRIQRWAEPSLAVKMGQEYIGRMVKQGKINVAWSALEFCFENNNKEYKLLSASTLLTLSEAASTFKQKSISVSILTYFEKDFPNYPGTPKILLGAAKMAADDLDDFKTAKTLMRQLRRQHPDIYPDETYQALRKILNT